MFETCLKLCKLQCKSNFEKNQVLLLMIENFEINQMVRGNVWSTFKPPKLLFGPLTPHLCPCHPPRYTKRVSIINTVTSQMSLFNHSLTIRARDLKCLHYVHNVSCVPCHMSGVTCHVSHVNCPMSKLKKKIKLFELVVEGLFVIETRWYPVITYLGL